MKKAITIILFFAALLPLSGQSEYDEFYGFGDKDRGDEFSTLNALSSPDGLISILKSQSSPDFDINDLREYVRLANEDNVFGTAIRDTLLIYVAWDFDEDFIELLESERTPENTEMIDYMIEVRRNKENLLFNHFCYSTFPIRYDCPMNISMILPNTEWHEQEIAPNIITMIAGDDYYAGFINFIEIQNPGTFSDVLEDGPAALKEITLPDLDTADPNDTISFTLDEPREINNPLDYSFWNEDLRSSQVKEIREQIFVSPESYSKQLFVLRRRYYIFEETCLVVTINGFLSPQHVLADRERLVRKYGFILDSLIFHEDN